MLNIQGIRYPSDFEAKKAIVEVGKRMYNKGFVASNDGNISCKVSPNTIWTTPTGVSKGFMTPDMLVKMTLDGKVLSGMNHKPSSEVKMHIRAYMENPNIMAVVHAHPPVATSFAIAGISLDSAILPEAVVNLGSVPIAKYATPGSMEVPDSIAPYCKTHNACLLANHGALTWGKDVFEAYYRMESLEYYATVLMYTGNVIGKANQLSCKQVDSLIEIREKLGIKGGGVPSCSLNETNTKDVITNNDNKMTRAKKEEFNQTSIPEPCGCSVSIKPNQEKEKSIDEIVKKVTEQILKYSGK